MKRRGKGEWRRDGDWDVAGMVMWMWMSLAWERKRGSTELKRLELGERYGWWRKWIGYPPSCRQDAHHLWSRQWLSRWINVINDSSLIFTGKNESCTRRRERERKNGDRWGNQTDEMVGGERKCVQCRCRFKATLFNNSPSNSLTNLSMIPLHDWSSHSLWHIADLNDRKKQRARNWKDWRS